VTWAEDRALRELCEFEASNPSAAPGDRGGGIPSKGSLSSIHLGHQCDKRNPDFTHTFW